MYNLKRVTNPVMNNSREFWIASAVGLAASVSIFFLWGTYRNDKTLTPRALAIQRTSKRTASNSDFVEEDMEMIVDEAPTILNALYIYSQDSAKKGG